MKKYNLVICDEDTVFMSSFQRFITKQEDSRDFKVRCFSSIEFLKKYVPIKEDILLITAELFFDDLYKYGFKNIVILDTTKSSEVKGPNSIKKFQPPSILLNEVKSYATDDGQVDNGTGMKNKSKLISFYSPVGGAGGTTVALLSAYSLAKQHNKVLYINLEDIQSTEAFLDCDHASKNIAHLLCFSNEELSKFTEGLKSIVRTNEKLRIDYFEPFDSVLDIQEFNKDAEELIGKIVSSGIYNYIILDIGNIIGTRNKHLLRDSEKVVMVTTQDVISVCKVTNIIEQFYDFKNIKLVVNKVEDKRENLIQQIVQDYPVTVIGKIYRNNLVEGVVDLELLAKNDDFYFDVSKVVENLLI